MRYEMMLPHHIKTAIEGDWPVVLPVGPLEYHGQHMSVGMDTLCVVKTAERLEAEMEMVLMPTFWWAPASYAVEGPELRGSFQVEAEHLIPVAKDMFRSMLRIGFRNIHFFIHHQSENFFQGMPADLAFRTGARTALFEFLEKERGEGWWGDNEMADYYAEHERGSDPFNWIRGYPLMDDEIISQYSFDHAGIGETSLMMELEPDSVDMDYLDTSKWYLESAKDANREYGAKGATMVLERMRRILTESRLGSS